MLNLTAAEAQTLSLDELALRILADYHANNGWNTRNWMLEHGQNPQAPTPPAQMRLYSEAWSWLDAKSLVAWDPGQDTPFSRFVTRRGVLVLERGVEHLYAVERLDFELVPALEQKARPQFMRGDFETAVFVAFKEVEVELRSRSGAPNSLVGVKLAREALGPGKPLARSGAEAGEVVAEMELFAGALGLFKNPSSHRAVDYESPALAAEAVLLADLLLRLLDR